MKIHFSYICDNAPATFKDSKSWSDKLSIQTRTFMTVLSDI